MAISTRSAQTRSYISDQLGMTVKDTQKYQVYDNEVYERRIVHRFRLTDCEDPEVYVAEPIWQWQQTDSGKWAMKHGRDLQYHMSMEPVTMGYQVVITAHITPKRWTEFCLRFDTSKI
jgi:hypothetical protein